MMSAGWRYGAIAVGVLVLAGVAGVVCVRRGTTLDAVETRVETGAEVSTVEKRTLRVDELALLARDFRAQAKKYTEQGDKKKAQRAIGAAQELDKKIGRMLQEQAHPDERR